MTKKNAGKAKIKSNAGKAPTKETVKTPFSECTAKDKLKCRFHGLQALHLMLPSILASGGYKGTFKAQKDEIDPNAYQFFLDGNTPLPDNLVSSLKEAFAKTGWNCEFEEEGVFEGQDHVFSLTRGKPDKTEQSTEEIQEEKDKVDEVDSGVEEEIEGLADLLLEDLKASQPPQPSEETSIAILKEAFDNFMSGLLKGGLHDEAEVKAYQEILEESKKNKTSKDWQNSIIKGKELKAAHDQKADEGVTKEDMKDFLKKYGLNDEDCWQKGGFDNVLNTWYVMLTTGKNNNTGATITTPGVKETLEEAIKLVGEDHKVSKAFKKKIAEMEEAEKQEEKAKSFRAPNGVVLTDKDFENFLAKQGTTTDKEFWKNYWKDMIKKGEAKNIDGELVKKSNLSPTLASYHGTDDPVIKALNLSSPSPTPPEAEEEDPEEDDLNSLLFDADKGKYDVNLTADDVQSFFSLPDSDTVAIQNWQTLLNTGKLLKSTVADYINSVGSWIQEQMKKAGKDHPVTKAWEKYGLKYPEDGKTGTEPQKQPEPPPNATAESAQQPQTSEKVELDENLLKPLEHDESKFPKKLTKKELEEAIAKGHSAGGHGGLHTAIVEIDGKKYICKSGSGKKANIIMNGFRADMAYRAGGIYAPDAKLYDFGDGKTYKLSEFIEGQRLIEVWKWADEGERDEIRKELLKGYPLDVLFSNYDVLGTSPEESQMVTIAGADGKPQKTNVAFDNIMVDMEGHCYRIDNDGSFFMTGTGGHKSSHGGSYTTAVNSEDWDNWDERQWIDDFRTLRRNEKNVGIFDRYTTADIFLAAGSINFDKVMESLSDAKPIQKGLEKPLFEMKQMAFRAVNMALGGYKDKNFISQALDASYEASKRGLRELCKKAISWNDSGFGMYKDHWGNYQPKPFGETPPPKPVDPQKSIAQKLPNSDYTGDKIAKIILDAAKTINHHGGVKQTDENGNVLGNGTAMSTPDYKPNSSKIAEFEKIDREKLAELAKTDESAKTLLGIYDTIVYSKDNGYKKPIGKVPTGLTIKEKLAEGFQSESEKKILSDIEGAKKKYQEDLKEYNKKLAEYEKRKSEHDARENAKAQAAGGSAYHNFHDFVSHLMEERINTDGIAHKQANNGISPIENSMSAQKGSSYAPDAVKWKIREMIALGYSIENIKKMAAEGKLFSGSSYTHMISSYEGSPVKEEALRLDMVSQAIYLGANMVKVENESNDMYDKKSGVIFLNRSISNTPQGLTPKEKKLYESQTEKGWIGPHVDSAADCMQFEANDWYGTAKQVYAVPFSRLVCCANNEKAHGGGYGCHSEQEYVGNLYMLPCWLYHPANKLTWKSSIDEAKKSEGMQKLLQSMAKRLSAFNTLVA